MLKQFCVWASFQPSVQDLEQYPCPVLTPVCPKQPSLGRIKTNSLEHHIAIHQITPNYHLSALREPWSFSFPTSLANKFSMFQVLHLDLQFFWGTGSNLWCLLVSGASNLLTALRAAHQCPTLKAKVFGFLTGFVRLCCELQLTLKKTEWIISCPVKLIISFCISGLGQHCSYPCSAFHSLAPITVGQS